MSSPPPQEYKQKLARVTQVRKELKSHIQSLPDLSLLPNVTGGLAPLPSAGDLFSNDWEALVQTNYPHASPHQTQPPVWFTEHFQLCHQPEDTCGHISPADSWPAGQQGGRDTRSNIWLNHNALQRRTETLSAWILPALSRSTRIPLHQLRMSLLPVCFYFVFNAGNVWALWGGAGLRRSIDRHTVWLCQSKVSFCVVCCGVSEQRWAICSQTSQRLHCEEDLPFVSFIFGVLSLSFFYRPVGGFDACVKLGKMSDWVQCTLLSVCFMSGQQLSQHCHFSNTS